MAPRNRRKGTHLTPDQIAEMRKMYNLRGKIAEQEDLDTPAEKAEQQHGTETDGFDAIPGPENADIFSTTLYCFNGKSDIFGVLSLGGLFDPTDPINAEYVLAFDSDNDPLTGEVLGDFVGIDYTLTITVQDDNGELLVRSEIFDWDLLLATPLSVPPEIIIREFLMGEDVDGEPFLDQIEFQIPKTMIGLSEFYDPSQPNQMPVGVLSKENGVLMDISFLIYHHDKWLQDPTIITYGNSVPTPGEEYDFTIEGLQPNDIFSLYLDDALMVTGTLDGSGNYSGFFEFPEDLPIDTFYFLTAQDSTGEFAYNITCPEKTASILEWHEHILLYDGQE